VFVDNSGRRRRLVTLVGALLAIAIAGGMVLLIASVSGGSGLHVPGFPDAGRTPVEGGPSGPAPSTAGAEPAPGESGGTVTAGVPEPTSPRRVPTQTPTHQPRPSKT
jgi:hypothetical protein